MKKRTNKVFAGIMVFAPIVAIALMFIPLVAMLTDLERTSRYNINNDLPEGFILFFLMLGIAVLLSIAGFIYFLIHAVNNPYLLKDHRVAWIVLMVFAGTLAHIAYFFMYIVPEGKEGPPPGF